MPDYNDKIFVYKVSVQSSPWEKWQVEEVYDGRECLTDILRYGLVEARETEEGEVGGEQTPVSVILHCFINWISGIESVELQDQ